MSISKYTVIEKLGEGGMAQVWLCRRRSIGGFEKLVVIKQILPRFASDPEFVRMFLDEARVVASVNHQNIVQVFDIEAARGVPYLAMEFVPGPTLSLLLREAKLTGKLNIAHGVRVMADICSGLNAAHNACDANGEPLGLVHRDVSPHNIVVSNEGIPKLLDFGVAKSKGRLSQTQVGTIKGKIAYMAPEQARHGGYVDHRADVYSVGVCLYQATTGRTPFHAENEAAMIMEVISGSYQPPSELVPNYPKELEEIIRWAMEPDQEKRCPSAQALREALEAFAQRDGLVSNIEGVAQWVAELFPTGVPRRASIGSSPGSSSPRAKSNTPRPMTPAPLTPRPSTPRGLTPPPSTPRASAPPSSRAGSASGSLPTWVSPPVAPLPLGAEPWESDSDAPPILDELPSEEGVDVELGSSGGQAPMGAEGAPGVAAPLAGGVASRRFAWVPVAGLAAGAVLAVVLAAALLLRSSSPVIVPPPPALPAPVALAKDPDADARAYLAEATRLAGQRQFGLASDVLAKARELAVGNPALEIEALRLASSLEREGRLDKARRALEANDLQAAIGYAHQLLASDPADADAAKVLAQVRQAQAAVAAAERAEARASRTVSARRPAVAEGVHRPDDSSASALLPPHQMASPGAFDPDGLTPSNPDALLPTGH